MSYRWLFSSPRGDALGRAAARHARRAPGPAAPGGGLLGRLLAVEHAVPAGRRRPDRLPGRRRDRRAAPDPVAGQRAYDVDLARERVGAELLDLQFGGLLPTEIDPIETADSLPPRYAALWEEVTHEQVVRRRGAAYRMRERLQRLNDLGFDVGEVELITFREGCAAAGAHAGGRAGPAPPGAVPADRTRGAGAAGPSAAQRHPRPTAPRWSRSRADRCRRARPRTAGSPRSTSPSWMPIPADLAGRLAPAEVFHEVLEHRWFLSEQAGPRRRDGGWPPAPTSPTVLPKTPRGGDDALGDRRSGRRTTDPRGSGSRSDGDFDPRPFELTPHCDLHHSPVRAMTASRRARQRRR